MDALLALSPAAVAAEKGQGMSLGQILVIAFLAFALPPLVLRLTYGRVGTWLAKRVVGLGVANLIAQAAIIVTGGAVRLTGSGLGCSDWPYCEPGAYTPEVFGAASYHPIVEFGNRTLTFVLLITAILLAIAVWHGRKELRWWGLVPYAGVMVQAIVGGIVVKQALAPLLVAGHLWISAALVWFSAWLWLRLRGSAVRPGGPSLAWPRRLSLVALAAVVVLGTLTTGAGPHAGDADAARLALNPSHVAKFHALSVWGFVLLVAWIAFVLWRRRDIAAEARARKAVAILMGATLLQAAIGYVQYFAGLPGAVVALHLVGIGVLVATHSAMFHLSRRA